VGDEPALPVYSRISWGAILAGAFVAFALSVLLNALGTAIGVSSDIRDTEKLATAAAIWSTVSVVLALFFGGWTTSCFTVGEDRREAFMYGIIVWGVCFASLLWLGTFASLNFSSMVGGRPRTDNDPTTIERLGRSAGLPAIDIDRLKSAAEEGVSPRTTAKAAWWGFAGTLLSMIAAIAGTIAGAAKQYRALWFTARRASVVSTQRAPT